MKTTRISWGASAAIRRFFGPLRLGAHYARPAIHQVGGPTGDNRHSRSGIVGVSLRSTRPQHYDLCVRYRGCRRTLCQRRDRKRGD